MTSNSVVKVNFNFLNGTLYFYYIILQLILRAFQNTIIKYFFIEYFSSYEAWNNFLILHKP